VTLDLVEKAVEGDGLGGSCFAPSSALVESVGNLDFTKVPRFFIVKVIGYSWLHFSIYLSKCPFKSICPFIP
ncbi:MAG: hypothetical protein K2P59_13300, partial [Acetatifactor sp.]|nr:hypothetical protein [Acetatifactor sp.]